MASLPDCIGRSEQAIVGIQFGIYLLQIGLVQGVLYAK